MGMAFRPFYKPPRWVHDKVRWAGCSASGAPKLVATLALTVFAASEPAVNSLAGFAFLRPQASIRRCAQPSWPSAMTCFFFSSFKTLLTLTEGIPHVRVDVLTTFSLAGFQVTTIGRIWVTAEAVLLCGTIPCVAVKN